MSAPEAPRHGRVGEIAVCVQRQLESHYALEPEAPVTDYLVAPDAVRHLGARHFRMYQRTGERMPVAIAFGGESVLPYAATCPLPPGISELLFAGFLHAASS